LAALADAIQHARGPILECGAGVSTLIAGVCAAAKGLSVWTLEQDPRWTEIVSSRTGNLPNVAILHAPLWQSWYDVRGLALPPVFDLALCDGPYEPLPGPAGYQCRVGLLTTQAFKVRTVLVDDAQQSTAVLAQWAAQGAHVTSLTADLARVTVP
jgi:hypothetical protein